MKKITLNQTWVLCLRMWRWIANVWKTERYIRYCVWELKDIWLKENGFKDVYSDCFFCQYREGANGDCNVVCPGALVDPNFDCYNIDYEWHRYPVEFYQELLRLNKIRKAKK